MVAYLCSVGESSGREGVEFKDRVLNNQALNSGKSFIMLFGLGELGMVSCKLS